MEIGFIGQGWIGKNYADDFGKRGYDVIRYSLEEPYKKNEDKIRECRIVFVAVPTPTRPDGFDDSILRSVMNHIGDGASVVIKSTMLPGTTESIQKEHPHLFIKHSPEFLTRSTAAHDTAFPTRNIVGIPIDNEEYRRRAQEVLDVLPKADYETICTAREAELVKYGRNCFFYFKNMFFNMYHDLVVSENCDWQKVHEAVMADPDINEKHHTEPIHDGGRGAGGDCLIKDFEAFIRKYEENIDDAVGLTALKGLRDKNIQLLRDTKKDLDLLKMVYGDSIYDL